jgi:hypothetical protein
MITCWLFQKWMSWNSDDNPAWPSWALRHARTCPVCRELHSSMRLTLRALAAGTGPERRHPSPFLRGKIMSAIRAGETMAPRPASGGMGWAIAAGTAAVLLLVAGVVSLPRAVTPIATGPRPRPVPEALALNLPGVMQVTSWSTNLDKPLDSEMHLVLADAQTAIKSLKESFLPVPSPGNSAGHDY